MLTMTACSGLMGDGTLLQKTVQTHVPCSLVLKSQEGRRGTQCVRRELSPLWSHAHSCSPRTTVLLNTRNEHQRLLNCSARTFLPNCKAATFHEQVAIAMLAPDCTVPSKPPLPWDDEGLHLTHGFLSPPKSPSQMASRLVKPFLYGLPMCQTDTQTDHATCVATGCILCCTCAIRPNNANIIVVFKCIVHTHTVV